MPNQQLNSVQKTVNFTKNTIYAKLGDLVSKQRYFFWLLQRTTFLFSLSCLRFPVPSAVSAAILINQSI